MKNVETEKTILIRRGRALIRKGEKILLCNRVGTNYWYLPGGKAESKEFADTALHRELEEEIGWIGTIDAFAGAFEHEFFDGRRNAQVQEVNMIFTLCFAFALPEAVQSRENHLRFKWVEIGKLAQSFFPVQLAPVLAGWLVDGKPFYANGNSAPKG